MIESPKESESQIEARFYDGVKSVTKNCRQEQVRCRDLIWNGYVESHFIKYHGGTEKNYFKWWRSGEVNSRRDDIAQELVSGPFDEAFAKDIDLHPELYAHFRAKSLIPVSELIGKSVEFSFESPLTNDPHCQGIGKFFAIPHADGTTTIGITVKNAAGGLNPRDANYYLSQKNVDAIKRNSAGSISAFSCFS
jgi:hypothetical protein